MGKSVMLQTLVPILVSIFIFLLGILLLGRNERIKLNEQNSFKMKLDKDLVKKQLKWGLKSLSETQKMLLTVSGVESENPTTLDLEVYKERLQKNYHFLLVVQDNPLITEILLDSSSVVKFASLMFMIQKEIILTTKNTNNRINTNLTKFSEELADEIKI